MADEKKKSKPVTVSEIMNRKKPSEKSVDVCLDRALKEEAMKATKNAGVISMKLRKAEADEDAERIAELEAELAAAELEAELAEIAVEENTVTFVFRTIGRHAANAIVSAHPPTAAQREAYAAELKAQGRPIEPLSWNAETLPPAIMAASSVEPKMSVEEAQELWTSDVFGSGELEELFLAAWTVNRLV